MPSRHLFTVLLLLIAAPALHAQAPAAGFERRTTAAGIEVGIWYPAAGTPVRQRLGLYEQAVVPDSVPTGRGRALVVISHGTGGDFAGHVDTAVALAQAGFVVAALTHPGDNWRDTGRATRIEERPAALAAVLSYMLADWSGRAVIDPARVGAFGFSAGGFTVLAAAGGRPDLTRMGAYCASHPTTFVCTLVKAQPRATAPAAIATAGDPRLKALVVAAPALGFTFDRAGLSAVRVPVQLWRPDDDRILPAPDYADAVRAALPRPAEFRTEPRAGHFDFLAPCADPAQAPAICTSAPGFDRAAFHTRFNAAVVAFFDRTLRR